MARSNRRRGRRQILLALLNSQRAQRLNALRMRAAATLDGEDPQDFVPFDLDRINDRLCWARFRFTQEQLRYLVGQLDIPERIVTVVGDVCPGLEGLCIMLRRMAFPTRY